MAMPSIFLSYSRQNLRVAVQLAQQLRVLGCDVWRDQDSLRGGQHWPQIIGEAIDRQALFLLLWSHHARQSHYVEMEWNIAVASAKPFVPCLLDDTPLPATLRMINALDVRDLTEALPKILDVLQQYAPTPGAAPAAAPDPARSTSGGLSSEERIGHEAEYAMLQRLYSQLSSGRGGHIVWITAPQAGWGRHALVQSLAGQAQHQGGAVVELDFHLHEGSAAAELAPYEALVRQHYPQSTQLIEPAWVACVAQLVRLVGEAEARAIWRRVDDNPERALATWLRHAARATPPGLLLLWEGFDLAPSPWLHLLRYVAEEICRDLPVLLLLTALAPAPLAQLQEAQRSPALQMAQRLIDQEWAACLWLDRVTVADVAQYLGPADPVLPARLHALADGIPAVIESLWRQWREATPPAVHLVAGRWSVAREDEVWVFGEARDQAQAFLDACLACADGPLDRERAEEMLGYAALEGLTCTAQVVAQAVGLDADELMDFWDDYLLGSDPTQGLLLDVGFTTVPVRGGGTTDLNRYRFAVPYLWHVWPRYLSAPQRRAQQRRLIPIVEEVYALDLDQVSLTLAALYDATEQPEQAEAYRQRHAQRQQRALSLDMLRWQITLMEGLVRDRSDDYQLFELRLDLGDRLWDERLGAEGVLQAAHAVTWARHQSPRTRLVRALNWLGEHLYLDGRLDEALTTAQEALTLAEAVSGAAHPQTATPLATLGRVLQETGDVARARAAYTRALQRFEPHRRWHEWKIEDLQQRLAALDAP